MGLVPQFEERKRETKICKIITLGKFYKDVSSVNSTISNKTKFIKILNINIF